MRLHHLHNTSLWNSQSSLATSGAPLQSIPRAVLNSSVPAPSALSPQGSTTSTDSGRGSTSAMDIHELRSDSTLDATSLSSRHEIQGFEEPIYETIPDHLVSDDSDDTLCEENRSSVAMDQILSNRVKGAAGGSNTYVDASEMRASVNGHASEDNDKTRYLNMTGHLQSKFALGRHDDTYATIGGDTPEGYVACASFHEYSTLTPTPPIPPERNSRHRASLPVRGSASQLNGVGRRKVGIKRTDIISNNPYHVYTVGEVLESFHRLASNIPTSPQQLPIPTPPNPNSSTRSEPTSNNCNDTLANPVYTQVRKHPLREPLKPRDLNTHRTSTRSHDHVAKNKDNSHAVKKETACHATRVLNPSQRNERSRDISHRHRSAARGTRSSPRVPPRGVPPRGHQRELRGVRCPSGTALRRGSGSRPPAPLWKPSISRLQGTFC